MTPVSALELKVPPAAVTAAFALLMWGVAVLTPALRVEIPGRRAIAYAFVAAAAVVAVAGVAAFRRAGTTVDPTRPDKASALVTSGIYRVTRNPIYLGLLLALVGWSVALAHPLALGLAGLFVVYMNRFQIRPEERALRAAFPEAFATYAQSTRRWM